ncbi:MAG: hypothetical protein ABFE01_28025 [Phycisphaerales bacterium]
MLRWTIRILVVFVVLILATAVILHFVLQSQWLRNLILARASEGIGMDVTADSLTVGWGGRTTIRGAAVAMPLTNDVLLAAERVEVVHEVVPLLLLGRAVNVRSVRVERPEVNLKQYPDGHWNVQDAWTRVQARLKPDKKRGEFSLPEVEIREAQIHIEEPNGAGQIVGPVSFTGRPQGRLLWQFDLEVPDSVGVRGQVVSGGDWAHAIGVRVSGVEPWVRSLVGKGVTPIRVTGQWEGKIVGGSLDGTLRLDALAVGPATAHGGIGVQAKSGDLSLTARDLVIDEPNVAGREIRLAGGSIRMVGDQIRIEQLAAASNQFTAQVNGVWDLSAQSGEISGSWAAVVDEQKARYDGTYLAAVKSPRSGRKTARVNVTGRAQAPFGELAVAADVEGDGPAWGQSQWQISTPTLSWSHQGKEVDLAGAAAEVRLAWPEVRLTDLRMPGTQTADVNATFDTDSRRWSVHVAIDHLTHLTPWGVQPLDLRLSAEGDTRTAHVRELRVAEGERVAVAKGRLSFRERGFQDVQVTADWPAGTAPSEPSRVESPLGHWHLEGGVFGHVQPLAIELTGQMTGRDISLGKETVSRIEIPVRAKANAEAIQMATDPVDMFGGRWQLNGRHDLSTNVTQIEASADALSLESVAAMAGLKLVSRGRAHARVQVAVRNLDVESAVATGSWEAEDVNIPPFQAEKARGKLRIAGGLARFDEILLERNGGQAEASVEFRLDDSQYLLVELTSRQWPAQFEGSPLTLYADGKAHLRVNVAGRTADGEARLSGTVLLNGQELAHVRVTALVEQQTVNIEDFYAETLGGEVDGQAQVRLDRWIDSSAKLRWQGIEPRMLQTWAPQIAPFEGTVSGSLVVGRADPASRPPEPMEFAMNMDVENGWFGGAAVGSSRFSGFLGPTRLLIDDAELRALDGQVKARVMISSHKNARYANIVSDFENLNLDQIVHVVSPKAKQHAGYLSGHATLLGSSSVLSGDFSPLQGQARISLTKSELGNSTIIGTLYNTMNLRFGSQEPNGTGDISVRIEGPSVLIPSFSYFNRGIEIRGAGKIENINRGSESPVSGFAVGSTQVLRGVRLPGVRSLDRLLATFQSSAASVSIEGSLAEPRVKVVPLPVILGPFRNLLWAELRE